MEKIRKVVVEKGIITDIISPSDTVSIEIDGKEYVFNSQCAIYPGLVDSHGHIVGYGMRKSEIDLSQADSFEHCLDILKNATLYRGDWLVGYGWNQENWTHKEFPNKSSIDSVFPNNPVFLLRIDGHSAVVNQEALKIAMIDGYTPNPPGGIIEKGKSGEPTGILIDNAINLISDLIPDYSFEQIVSFIELAIQELAKYGITEIHDMDVMPHHIPIFQDLDFRNQLPLRINAYVRAQNNEWLRDGVIAYKGRNYSITGLKYYLDGALGSRGAALLTAYSDAKDEIGLVLLDENSLFNRAKRGILSGFDIAIHTIGDRAIRKALDVIERLRKAPILKGKGNFRLEHAQIVHLDDLPRFKELNVTASVQPIHFASDACGMAQSRLANRLDTNSYLWKSFIDNDVRLIAGSDFPIESPCPIEGIRTFLHRKSNNENYIFPKNECLTINQVIQSYCHNPRIETRDNVLRGSIELGKQADLTILSAPLELLDNNYNQEINVMATIVGGNVVYHNVEK